MEDRNTDARTQTETELLKLHAAVNSAAEVIFMTDCEGVFTFVNPEFTRLYGYTAKEVVGKVTPRVLKSGMLKPEVYESFWQTITSGGIAKAEYVNKAKGGQLLIIEGSASPIFNERQEVVGYMAIQQNITERKQTEKELQEAREEIKILSGILTICGYCKKIRDDQEHWKPIEVYISDHSEANFSHGICPECIKIHFPEYSD